MESVGRLLIVGPELGKYNSLSTTPQEFKDFYKNKLGAEFVEDDVFDYNFELKPFDSDIVFKPESNLQSIKLTHLSGGGFYYADKIKEAGTGVKCLYFNTTGGVPEDSIAAIRNEGISGNNLWKTMYLSFFMELIASTTVRNKVFGNTLCYLDGYTKFNL